MHKVINAALISLGIAAGGIVAGCEYSFNSNYFEFSSDGLGGSAEDEEVYSRFDIASYTAIAGSDESLEGLWVITSYFEDNITDVYGFNQAGVDAPITSTLTLSSDIYVRSFCNIYLDDDTQTADIIEYRTEGCQLGALHLDEEQLLYSPGVNALTSTLGNLALAESDLNLMTGQIDAVSGQQQNLSMKRIADIGQVLGRLSLTQDSVTDVDNEVSSFYEAETDLHINVPGLSYEESITLRSFTIVAPSGAIEVRQISDTYTGIDSTMEVEVDGDTQTVGVYDMWELGFSQQLHAESTNLQVSDRQTLFKDELVNGSDPANLPADGSLDININENTSSVFSLIFTGNDTSVSESFQGQSTLSF